MKKVFLFFCASEMDFPLKMFQIPHFFNVYQIEAFCGASKNIFCPKSFDWKIFSYHGWLKSCQIIFCRLLRISDQRDLNRNKILSKGNFSHKAP